MTMEEVEVFVNVKAELSEVVIKILPRVTVQELVATSGVNCVWMNETLHVDGTWEAMHLFRLTLQKCLFMLHEEFEGSSLVVKDEKSFDGADITSAFAFESDKQIIGPLFSECTIDDSAPSNFNKHCEQLGNYSLPVGFDNFNGEIDAIYTNSLTNTLTSEKGGVTVASSTVDHQNENQDGRETSQLQDSENDSSHGPESVKSIHMIIEKSDLTSTRCAKSTIRGKIRRDVIRVLRRLEKKNQPSETLVPEKTSNDMVPEKTSSDIVETSCDDESTTSPSRERVSIAVCDICGYRSSTQGVERHRRLRHPKPIVFICHICGRKFDRIHSLNKHKLLHTTTDTKIDGEHSLAIQKQRKRGRPSIANSKQIVQQTPENPTINHVYHSSVFDVPSQKADSEYFSSLLGIVPNDLHSPNEEETANLDTHITSADTVLFPNDAINNVSSGHDGLFSATFPVSFGGEQSQILGTEERLSDIGASDLEIGPADHQNGLDVNSHGLEDPNSLVHLQTFGPSLNANQSFFVVRQLESGQLLILKSTQDEITTQSTESDNIHTPDASAVKPVDDTSLNLDIGLVEPVQQNILSPDYLVANNTALADEGFPNFAFNSLPGNISEHDSQIFCVPKLKVKSKETRNVERATHDIPVASTSSHLTVLHIPDTPSNISAIDNISSAFPASVNSLLNSETEVEKLMKSEMELTESTEQSEQNHSAEIGDLNVYEESCEEDSVETSYNPTRSPRLRKQHKSVNLECPVNACAFTTEKMARMNEHIRLRHVKMWRCTECDESFHSKVALQNHVVESHDTQVTCQICEKNMPSRDYLVIHMERDHKDLQLHFCPTCKEGFEDRDQMLKHSAEHLADEAQREFTFFTCSYCPKQFTRRSVLQQHENAHTGTRPYECQQCGKGFAYHSHLARHRLVHTAERKHQCPECGRGFPFPYKLAQHMTTHTKQSKHQCQDCGKCFVTTTSLKKHSCKAAFGSSNDVPKQRIRARKLNDAVPETEDTSSITNSFNDRTVRDRNSRKFINYICSHCGEAFFSLAGFNEHMTSKHPTSTNIKLVVTSGH